MKQMYRGVRIKKGYENDVLLNGMDYYWKNPEEAVSDIFYTMKKFNIQNKLSRNGMLECRIKEASSMDRLQIYGSEEKYVAESYARATPELIYLTLQNGLIKESKITEYLNKRYGLPYVVTFNIDAQPTYFSEINKKVGFHISPEFIVSVEPVDITKEDPVMVKLGTI